MEIVLVREGECNKCGFCCPRSCPHRTVDKKCAVYESRGDFCSVCHSTHQKCIDFPLWPMKRWTSKCGFHFYLKDRPDLEVFALLLGGKEEED